MYQRYPQEPSLQTRVGQWLFNLYKMRRVMIFGVIIFSAMLAFELFNYSTTDFALNDLLGDVRFVGIRWAMILSIAFCGIDFAGIARLFTPEKGRNERTEVWYLLAAWFLAATMNAMLTWWGVSIQLLHHNSLGNEILDRRALLSVVPIFVAVLVWLIRILLIGLLSMTGERLFSATETAVQRSTKREEADRWVPANTRPTSTSTPTPSRVAQPQTARLLKEAMEDDDFDQRRRQAETPATYRRPTMPSTQQRPVAPPAPPPAVRPVPKPSPTMPNYAPAAAAGERPTTGSRPYVVGGTGSNGHEHS